MAMAAAAMEEVAMAMTMEELVKEVMALVEVAIQEMTRVSETPERKKTTADLVLPPGELERMVEETRTAKVVRVIAVIANN